MRLRRDGLRFACLLVALVAAAPVSARALTKQDASLPEAGRPSDEDISRALESVKVDPDLFPERSMKVLRWRSSNAPGKWPRLPRLTWLVGLFTWLEQSARVLVWGLALAAILLLVAFVARITRGRTPLSVDRPPPAPTHVRDLDIRPESLPADVGGAAHALWNDGRRRAALALLYRGLLSRLAHVHGIAIRDSSTEGDCLALARERLAAAPYGYAARLVAVWVRSVYGNEDPEPETVHELCDSFSSALNGRAPVAPLPDGERR